MHRRYAVEGTNVVLLGISDVARMFPNRQAVNETLRSKWAQKIVTQKYRNEGRDGHFKKGVARGTAARALVGEIVSGLVRGKRRVISSASRENQGIKTGKVITAFL